jgi:hypothetical protein
VRRQPCRRLVVEDLDGDVVPVGVLPRQRVGGEESHLVSTREARGDARVDFVDQPVRAGEDRAVADVGVAAGEAREDEVDEALHVALQAEPGGESTAALPDVVRRSELLRAGRAVAEILEETRERERLRQPPTKRIDWKF